MCELKEMESYLRVNLLGPGPRLMKKEFTGPRSHKGLRDTGLVTLIIYIYIYITSSWTVLSYT